MRLGSGPGKGVPVAEPSAACILPQHDEISCVKKAEESLKKCDGDCKGRM